MNDTRGNHNTEATGMSRRDLLKRLSPLGKVRLDKSACTGCGLCASECPTEALTFSSGGEPDTYRMLFNHRLCTACNSCVEVCPENCLFLERTVDTDLLDGPAVVLFEDEIIRCADCGSPFATGAMIARMKDKLPATGGFPALRFDLCPGCKARMQMTRPGN